MRTAELQPQKSAAMKYDDLEKTLASRRNQAVIVPADA